MRPFKQMMAWLAFVTVTGAAFLILIYCAANIYAQDMKRPVEYQLAAIRKQDIQLAYTFTSKKYQSDNSFKEFTHFVNYYTGLRNNERITYQKRAVDNETGILNATLISRGGSETTIKYRLIRENGRWKIDSMVINPSDKDETIDFHAISD